MLKILIGIQDREEAIKINNLLQENNYSSYIVPDPNSLINKTRSDGFKMLIIDSEFAEKSELGLVKFIKEINPQAQVILISTKERLDNSIDTVKDNAFMHITKPVNPKELLFVIRKAEELLGSYKRIETDTQDYFSTAFIGKSEKIKKIMLLAKKVARGNSNVLITGETGTGKELLARGIHEMSLRARNPFIAVNCAAIPDNLIESELFGYRKGAFTGATGDKKGLAELADSGTLFLDEIGDLSLTLQAKVLRVLEYKEIRRLGDEKMIKADIRIIAATNQDLVQLIKERSFREDLFFRLNVINIHIPPLRERREDLPLLIRYFIEKNNKMHGRNIVGIDQKTRNALASYDYPGNVRELANIIEHSVVMSTSDVISFGDLPFALQQFNPSRRLEAHGADKHALEDGEMTLSAMEKNAITAAFARHGRSHSRVAKALGISRSTLWRKMKEYGIAIG